MLMDKKVLGISVGDMPLWKYFLFAMIACFSLSALIIIIFILGGWTFMGGAVGMLLLKICASSSVLGLFSLFTMNNLFRRESSNNYVRIASTAALVLNIVWVLPWLLVVWDAFDGLKNRCVEPSYSYYSYYDYDYDSESYRKAEEEYRNAWNNYQQCKMPYENALTIASKTIVNGIILAIILTTIAEYLGYENYTSAIRGMKYTTIALAITIGGYILLLINFGEFSLIGPITVRVLAVGFIVLIFCAIVTPVLVRVQKRKLNPPATAAATTTSNEQQAAVPVIDEKAIKERIRAEVEAEERERIRKEVLAEMEAKNNHSEPHYDKTITSSEKPDDSDPYLNGA